MSDDLPAFSPDFGRAAPAPAQQTAARISARLKEHSQAWSAENMLLREWRVSRGWSQFEAAKQTGVSLSTWIRWETKGVPELRRARVREMLK